MNALLRRSDFTAVLYCVLSVFVFLMWVWSAETPQTSFNGDPRSRLGDMIYGRAHKPYVERVLVPIMTRAVCSVVSASTRGSFENMLLSSQKVQKEMARLGWEGEYLLEYLVALSIACCSLVAFPFVLRAMFGALYQTDAAVINAVPAAALLLLPAYFHVGPHYVYDFPQLFLFSSAIWLLAVRRLNWYYVVFAVACLNKETSLLLVLLFSLIMFGSLNKQTLLAHLAVQLVLWLGIAFMIKSQFLGNPGQSLEFRLHANIHWLLLPYSLHSLVLFAGVLTLILFDLHRKHVVLQRALIMAAAFPVLMMVTGVVWEIRAMYEIHAVLVLLAAHTAIFSWGRVDYDLKLVPAS